MMADPVRIEGLAEIAAAMRKLPIRVEERVAGNAMKKAGIVIEDIAVNNALTQFHKYSEGLLAEHIGTRRKKKRSLAPGVAAGAYVAVMSDTQEGGLKRKKAKQKRSGGLGKLGRAIRSTGYTGFKNSEVYYWRFLEFGTSKMGAKPFMRPAAESGAARAIAVGIDQMKRGIEREAKKLKKK